METAEKTQSKKATKAQMGDASNPVIIKRYQNRKMYNTQSSCYMTLGELQALVEKEVHIQVIDNASKKDVTGKTMIDILMQKAKASLDLHDKEVQDKIRTMIQNASIIA